MNLFCLFELMVILMMMLMLMMMVLKGGADAAQEVVGFEIITRTNRSKSINT